MLVATRAAIRTARQPTPHACRIVAGVRQALPAKGFHSSRITRQLPDDPTLPVSNNQAGSKEYDDSSYQDETASGAVASETKPENTSGTSVVTQKGGRTREGYGSAARRAVRNRVPKELPPVVVPALFIKENIILHSDNGIGTQEVPSPDQHTQAYSNSLPDVEVLSPKSHSISDANLSTGDASSGAEPGDDQFKQLDSDHLIHTTIYRELLTTCRASLSLRPPEGIELNQIPRPDTVLFCPRPEGSTFLDATVRGLASELGANTLILGPDDLAQIVGGYLGENIAWTYANTSLLGYDVHKVSGKMEDFEGFEVLDSASEIEDPEDGGEHEDPIPDFVRKLNSSSSRMKALGSRSRGVLVGVSSGATSQPMSLSDFFGASAASGNPTSSQSGADPWADLKTTAVFETLINTAISKQPSLSDTEIPSKDENSPQLAPKDLIIQVRHYKELDSLPQGQALLKKLREVVKKHWHDGLNVIIVGTTTTELPEPSLSRNGIYLLQSEITKSEYRTILVPPPSLKDLHESTSFIDDEWRYICSINQRHIFDMVRSLANVEISAEPEANLEDSKFDESFGRRVFEYGYVYRIAFAVLGNLKNRTQCSTTDIQHALEAIIESDDYKLERVKDKSAEETSLNGAYSSRNSANQATSDTFHLSDKQRMNRIKKDASRHEKKLLAGIVQPSDIKTTFAHIRTPPVTIEALKTLTSLSLQRPDAFRYGILATQKIPGILLYGPPGTGKTMLAKAVAKESGATVLEVSGSEINDMYVGEGEKNVKALFSLARKLSPCVIFIDEADAMFGSRGGDSAKRTSHRELINQFLRELDGMTDFTGILMVATNRPFDLDEAVLRRLPRRILIDLPLEQDREAILKIHLADELLDPSVDLTALAKDTPLYSGSDLKNLSVAAALACVREENDAAAKHTGDAPYRFPDKRILGKAHFDKAMEEISASISEDMSTLKAIRKFDERYGDRKGRRKKASTLGFGGLVPPDRDSEAGRVRSLPGLVV